MKKYMLALVVAALLGVLSGCGESKPQFKEGELVLNEVSGVASADIDAQITRYNEFSPSEMVSVLGEFEEKMGMKFTEFIGKFPVEYSLTEFYSLNLRDVDVYTFHDYVFTFDSESGKQINLSVSPLGIPAFDIIVQSDIPVHCNLNGATVTGYELNDSYYALVHYGELDYILDVRGVSEDEFEALILSLTESVSVSDVILSNRAEDSVNILTPSDSKFFTELISDESRYVQTVPNCLMDCILKVDGIDMEYHSDCGNLVRWDNGKCITLTEDEKIRLNEVFGKYMTLGFGRPEEKVEASVPDIWISKPVYSSIKSFSAEDAKVLGEILLDDSRYVNTASNCSFDFELQVNNVSYAYHSDCGTFSDTENGRILKLTESEKELVNEIVNKYYPIDYSISEEVNEVRVGKTSSNSSDPNTFVKPVTAAHADKIVSFLSDESRFVEGTGDCLNDCIVAVNGTVYYYHSDCGTFNDNSNNRSYDLTDAERFEVNAILSYYITLGTDIDSSTSEISEPRAQLFDGVGWGISFDVENVSPTGLTLICTHDGGFVFGDFVTGQDYGLEVKEKYDWVAVKPIVDEIYWNEIAYEIKTDGVTKWDIDWSKLYGELPTGEYRIVKKIIGHVNMVNIATENYYGYFKIGEPADPIIDDEWGIQFEATDVSATGIKLGIMQYGGENTGYTYLLDHAFWIEKFENGSWEFVPYAIEDVSWIVPPLPEINNDTYSFTEDWYYYYGALPAGKYRYCRNVIVYNAVDSRYQDGKHLRKPYYAEFEIVDSWGVTLSAKNVTDESITIVCEQNGDKNDAEFLTGSYYTIQKSVNGSWRTVDYLPQEYDVSWTAEAWLIPENDTVEWHENWAWLYGKLSPGKYRIGKSITYFRGTGDYDEKMYYAEFEISDLDALAAEEWGVTLRVDDITADGLTVYLTQQGETPGETLKFNGKVLTDMATDMSYWIERKVDGEWKKVEYLSSDIVPTWSTVTEKIVMDSTTNWKLEWKNYYGSLPADKYRICKTIAAKLPDNSIQKFNVYAEFDITRDSGCNSEDFGLSAHVKNVTQTGATYILSQSTENVSNFVKIINSPNNIRLVYGRDIDSLSFISSFEVGGSDFYILERLEDENWVKIEPKIDCFVSVGDAYVIPIGSSKKFTINWGERYGRLSEGKYRIGKNVSSRFGTENLEMTVYAEFEIE